MWIRSLTRLVSRTVRLSTGDSAGAPGLFPVDADTSPFRVRGRHARVPRVCVHALLGGVGRAGLPGTFWCASPFLWLFCHPSLFGPLRAWVARAFTSFVLRFLPLSSHLRPRSPALAGFLCIPALGALGLGALGLTLPPPPVPPPYFLLVSFCSPAFSALLRPLDPLLLDFLRFPLPSTRLSRFSVSCFVFFPLLLPPRGALCCCFRPPHFPSLFFCFSFFAPSPYLSCLAFSVVSSPGCPGPRRFVSAHPTRHSSLSLSFFLLRVPAFSWFRALLVVLASAPARSVSFSSSVCELACGVCAACCGCPPPPPPSAARVSLCLVSCCVVPQSVVGCFVWFVAFCGVFRCLGVLVLCCVGCCPALLRSVLSCVVPLRVVVWCVELCVVAGGLPWALLPPSLLVSCGALLCRAVL